MRQRECRGGGGQRVLHTLTHTRRSGIRTASLASEADAEPAPSIGTPKLAAHVQLCLNRYRSYRMDSNSYTPCSGRSRCGRRPAERTQLSCRKSTRDCYLCFTSSRLYAIHLAGQAKVNRGHMNKTIGSAREPREQCRLSNSGRAIDAAFGQDQRYVRSDELAA
ncbi:BA14K family protein [Aquibium sp. ELW1220]|uniref:BA14K family protein n=1 Tax=Aquibium sp. ELW1220 TaxID=2976766 RepID=UPI00339D61CD